MSVRQVGDKWLAEVNIKGFPRKRKTFELKVDALKFEQDLLSQYRVEKNRDNRTLKTLVGLWYELHGITLENHEARKRLLDETATALGNPVAVDLKPAAVLLFRAKRLRVVKGKTWNNQLGLLKSVYNKLVELKELDYPNPIASVQPLKLQEQQVSYLTLSEITKLLDEIKQGGRNESTWYVASLCLQTGARWGEAEQLKAKQLHSGMVTFENTKGKRVRSIPLDPVFYAALGNFALGKGNNERVFENCEKAFAHAVKRAEIQIPKGQSTHICRHTFASHFVMNGGHLLTLQKILGHTDIKQTLRYAHLAPDYLLDAAKLNPLQFSDAG